METVAHSFALNPPELLQLAQRIHAGERAAEGELVQRYRKVVFAMVRRRCRPGESQVEDLVQDVLTSLIQRLRRENMQDQPVVAEYLRAAVHHRCLSFYRMATQRWELQPAQMPEQRACTDGLGLALQQERAGQVRSLIASLPMSRDRDVLRLFYLEQMDRTEICARLQIEAEHFRRVLHRARQRMLLHIPTDELDQLRS